MKQILPFIVIAGLVSFNASAAEEGFYVGAGIGATQFDNDNLEELNADQTNLEFGYQLFGGYSFTPNWSAELGYTNYGDYTVDDADIDFLHVKTESEALYLKGIYHWLLTDRISADFSLGVVRAEGTSEIIIDPNPFVSCDTPPLVGTCKANDKTWGVSGGAGATWAISNQLKLRGTVDFFTVDYEDQASENTFKNPWRIGADLYWQF